ncbi:MAG: 16S rRNA (adenine(1518)-N(6)/adenine(1519)-N(6))-dimethyltransferase RsmA [Bacilli bacterium]
MDNTHFEYKKSLGQNFLKDTNLVKKIVSCVNLTKKDLVIEVGPGFGIMTNIISDEAKSVLAYEIDKRLEDELLLLADRKKNITFIFDDFLKRNIKDDIKDFKYNKLYFISNLPYYITTPIITSLIDQLVEVDAMVVMVQKEVGDRFCAKPQSKNYGSLTVFLNYYFKITKQFVIKKEAFVPSPKVDSVVVLFERKKELLNVADFNHFFKLVRDSFRFKRKTLRNNLKDYNFDVIEEVLKKFNKSSSSRAEELPLDIFVEISNRLVK